MRIGFSLVILGFIFSSCGMGKWDEYIESELAKLDPLTGEFYENVIYKKTPTKKLELDVFLPDVFTNDPSQSDDLYPVFVYIHGGSWLGGVRSLIFLDEANPVLQLRAKGVVVVPISYRFLKEAPFAKIAEDISDAFDFMKANSAQYHLDMKNVVIHGQSSGAHLMLQYAANHCAKLPADTDIVIKAVVNEFGPTDLVTLADATPIFYDYGMNSGVLNLIPKSSRYENSPINLVTSRFPDIFFLHGDRDDLVPLSQALRLKTKLELLFGEFAPSEKIRFDLIQDGGHGFYGDDLGEARILEIRQSVIDYAVEKLFP